MQKNNNLCPQQRQEQEPERTALKSFQAFALVVIDEIQGSQLAQCSMRRNRGHLETVQQLCGFVPGLILFAILE